MMSIAGVVIGTVATITCLALTFALIPQGLMAWRAWRRGE
jgi:hypothetical protein